MWLAFIQVLKWSTLHSTKNLEGHNKAIEMDAVFVEHLQIIAFQIPYTMEDCIQKKDVQKFILSSRPCSSHHGNTREHT